MMTHRTPMLSVRVPGAMPARATHDLPWGKITRNTSTNDVQIESPLCDIGLARWRWKG